jgi:hypothetical protein
MKLTMRTLTAVLAATIASSAWAEQVRYNGVYMNASEALSMPASPSVSEALGSTPGGRPQDARWGTAHWTTYTVQPGDFVNREGCGTATDIDNSTLAYIGPKSGATEICVGAPLHLPAGAYITHATLSGYDSDTTYNPSVGLWKAPISGTAGTGTIVQGLTITGDFSPGHFWQHFALSTPETVTDNWNNIYYVLAILRRNGSEVQQINGVVIWYYLQISPAPATATFSDVPTSHWAFQYVEALKASGITTGATPTTFNPNGTVSRAEMAVFLSRALGLNWIN